MHRWIKFAAASLALPALAACSKMERIIDAMTGKTTNIVVLADQPLMIGAAEIALPAGVIRNHGGYGSAWYSLARCRPRPRFFAARLSLNARI